MDPEEPIVNFGALPDISGNKSRVLLRHVLQDAASLKHRQRRVKGPVYQCWNLRVWIDVNKPRTELIELHDVDLPCVVFEALQIMQLLQQNRDLLAIWRAQGVKLQIMFANGKLFLGAFSCCRAVHPSCDDDDVG